MEKNNPEWLNRDQEESLSKCIEYELADYNKIDIGFKFADKFIDLMGPFRKEYNPLDEKTFLNNLYTFHWSVNNDCNLRCKHCNFLRSDYYVEKNEQDSSNYGKNLTTEECFNLIDELSDLGILKIVISGGEPFFRQDMPDIINYIKSRDRNISIYLQTNSVLINDEIISKIKPALNPLLDMIQVSFDGASKESFEKTRGEGTFLKVCENIKKLVQNNINVALQCTITTNNFLELPDIYNLACDLGVYSIGFSKYIPESDDDVLVPDPDTVYKAVAEIIDLSLNKQNNKCKLTISGLKDRIDIINDDKLVNILKASKASIKADLPDRFYCRSPYNADTLTCRGHNIGFCNIDTSFKEPFAMGNLRKSSLKEIWNNRYKNMLFQGFDVEKIICKHCDYFFDCPKICPLDSYDKTGNLYSPPANCKIAKELEKKYGKAYESELVQK